MPDDKQCFAVLTSKHNVSRDTIHMDFTFQDGVKRVLPVGKHLKVMAPNPCAPGETWNGEEDEDEGEPVFGRKYTPCTVREDGFVLIVKVYSPAPPLFPQGGKMSQYLGNVPVGASVEFALPFGVIEYFGRGEFRRVKTLVLTKHVGMVAAGSGITPMLRLLEESLKEEKDEEEGVKFSLLFANRDVDDVICKPRLDELARLHPSRLTVTYILSQPTKEQQSWPGGLTGRCNAQVLASVLPAPDSAPLILLCGPPAMIKTCCKPALAELGYDAKLVWDF